MKLHLPKMLTVALLAALASLTQATGTTLDNAALSLGDFTTASLTAAQDQGWTFTNITGDTSGIYTSVSGQQASINHDTDWAVLTDEKSPRNKWSGIIQVDATSLLNVATSGSGILLQQTKNNLGGVGFKDGKETGAWTGNAYPDLTLTAKTLAQCADADGNITIGVVTMGNSGTAIYIADGQQNVYSEALEGLKGGANSANIGMILTAAGGVQYKQLYLFGDEVSKTDMSTMMQSLVTPLTTTEYVWSATGETAAWDTATGNWQVGGETRTFKSSELSNATFGDGTVAKAVTIGEDIAAGTVTVNDDYSFTVATGHTLTIDALSVAAGKTATMAGEGTISLGTLAGALAIEAGTTVNMPGTVTLSGSNTLNVSGEGTLAVTTVKVAGGTHNFNSCLNVTGGGNGEGATNNKLGIHFSGANGTLNINAGTTTVSGAVYSNQNGSKLNIGTGEKEATLVARRIELSDVGSSALNIGAKGKMVITSDNDANGSTGAYKTTGLLLSEWNGSTTATIEGKLYAQNVSMYTGDAGMTLNINQGGVVAVKGIATNLAQSGHTSSSTINLAEGGKIVLGASGMADCTIAPWTINLNGGEIGITADATIARALNVAGNVTFNTAKYTWDGSGASLELKDGTEGGTLTVSGNITGTGTITKTGEGTLILSGTSNVLSNTIQAKGGTLTMNGSFTIDNITGGGVVADFVNAAGEKAASGFSRKSGSITVYSQDGGTVDATNATFTLGGQKVELTNGTATIAPTVDHSTLWVNEGSLSFNEYKTVAGDALTKVNLAATGTSITMDAAASVGVTVADSADSTSIVATQDITLTSLAGPAEGKTLTISAAGHTVAVQGDNSFMGNIVVDKGTVKLDSGAQQRSLGEYNGNHDKGQPAPAPNKTITVNEGGTIDLNGKADLTYVYTLNGGSLVNNGSGIGNGSMQTVGIKLTKDSTIGGTGNFYLLGPGYDKTFVTLDGKKLTKTGSNSVGFRNTNVDAGTIEVKEGNIEFIDDVNSSLAADIVLDGGTISGTIRSAGEISVNALKETTLKGLGVLSGQVDVIGTVNVSGSSLDASVGGKSTGVVHVTDEGELNVNSGMWLCSNSKIEVEEGGAFNIAGLSITGSGEDAIISSNANQSYSTQSSAFSITNAAITATADVTIGNTLTNTDVVTGAHSVTLNSSADSVTVSDGGSFTKGAEAAVSNITVEGSGTVAGALEMGDVTIAVDATATFSDETSVSDLDDGVFIYNLQNPIMVQNIGQEAAKYTGLHQEGMKVSADTLYSSADGATVENTVAVESIQHIGPGSITLAHVDADPLDSVSVTDGSLVMQDVTSAVISSMEIGINASVAVYTDGTQATEGTVTIDAGCILTAGEGSTLYANLVLEEGATWNLMGSSMNLGSTLQLATLITLDDATLQNLDDDLNVGDFYALACDASGHGIEYLGQTGVDAWYDGVFSRQGEHYTLEGDFYLDVQDGDFGLVKVSKTPEPTTGTLSLLALCALAARRRRK